MININSILSSFNEKGTLLKWLKKVEKALRESVLESANVNLINETTAQIYFTFADGTTLFTPAFTLPRGAQGEQGVPGAPGVSVTNVAVNVSNHLIVTLSNGTIIDAGTINATLANSLRIQTDTATYQTYDGTQQINVSQIYSAKTVVVANMVSSIVNPIVACAGGSTTNRQMLYDNTNGVGYRKSDHKFVGVRAEYADTADTLDSGNATQGQIATADGNGGMSWQTPTGGGTMYMHKILVFGTDDMDVMLNEPITLRIINSTVSPITSATGIAYYSDCLAYGYYENNIVTGMNVDKYFVFNIRNMATAIDSILYVNVDNVQDIVTAL